jgi:hypothetical protein
MNYGSVEAPYQVSVLPSPQDQRQPTLSPHKPAECYLPPGPHQLLLHPCLCTPQHQPPLLQNHLFHRRCLSHNVNPSPSIAATTDNCQEATSPVVRKEPVRSSLRLTNHSVVHLKRQRSSYPQYVPLIQQPKTGFPPVCSSLLGVGKEDSRSGASPFLSNATARPCKPCSVCRKD